MKHYPLHLKILIVLSFLLGIGLILYQVLYLQIPLTKQEVANVWTVDAKIELPANEKRIKVKMFLPPENPGFKRIFEAFVPENDYGKKIETQGDNRVVTLSARKNYGKTFYYRTQIAAVDNHKKDGAAPVTDDADSIREPIKIDDEVQQKAVEAIVKEARSKSIDVETIVSQVIQKINDYKNSSDVQILLEKNYSQANIIRVIELVLSQVKVGIEVAHVINLDVKEQQTAEMWLRTFVNGDWLYFNLASGKSGLSKNRFVWWFGSDKMVNLPNAAQATVSFNVKATTENRLELLREQDIEAKGRDVLEFSFYSLPLEIQNKFMVMLMIPFGVLVVLVLRNLIGFSTLGTFTPVLIALAFRETTLITGIILFSSITALGLLVRAYLESLKLQMLPRLSIVLTFVVALISFLGLFSHKLALSGGLALTLFPMVILTMTIERMSITWEERGAHETSKVALGTLLAASLAYFLMNLSVLSYFVFTFPAVLLVLVAFMLIMGRYRGYRLFELVRFKALEKE